MTAILRYRNSFAGAAGGGVTAGSTLPLIAAGDAILVGTFTTGTQTITGVSDGVNSYAKIGSNANASAGTVELWTALNVAASAVPLSIMATWSATAAFASIFVQGVSYLATSAVLDVQGPSTGSSITMSNSGTQNTTALAELSIGLLVGAGKPLAANPGGTGWIAGSTILQANGFGVALLAANTANPVSLSWNQNVTGAWACYCASLKSAPVTSYVLVPSNAPSAINRSPFSYTRPQVAISPAMPYPATVGQTWPPPFGGQYPST